MTDLYGNLPLPIPKPREGEVAGDPSIQVIGEFLHAILNGHASELWTEVGPYGDGQPAKSLLFYNPSRYGVNEADLPALYVWREKVLSSERIGADYYVRNSEVMAVWIPPMPKDRNESIRRDPVFNAISAIFDNVLDPLARDPSWVVPQDTDPKAQTEGSLLWNFLNAWSFDVGKSDRMKVAVEMDDQSEPMVFDAVACYCELKERNATDVTSIADELDGVEGVGQNDGKDILPFVLKLTINLVSPDTGTAAGGTTVLIRGTGFSEDAPPTVVFGITEAPSVTVLDGNLLAVITPPGALGARDVKVTNPGGETQTVASAFTYT